MMSLVCYTNFRSVVLFVNDKRYCVIVINGIVLIVLPGALLYTCLNLLEGNNLYSKEAIRVKFSEYPINLW